jgi:adenosylmethionine-8-amino-7-oxononanoate aminotransferase
MKKTAGGVMIACAVCLIMALCLQASGSILVFTSRDEWTAANNGNVNFLQDFNAANFQLSADVRQQGLMAGIELVRMLQEQGAQTGHSTPGEIAQ